MIIVPVPRHDFFCVHTVPVR